MKYSTQDKASTQRLPLTQRYSSPTTYGLWPSRGER